MINYDDFAKVEIKVGKIISVEKIPDSEKLLKLMVDFGWLKPSLEDGSPDHLPEANDLGKNDIRQIISGISKYFPDEQVLVGKKTMFVTNLEPRKLMGHESNGMLFAVSTDEGAFSLMEVGEDIPQGTKAK